MQKQVMLQQLKTNIIYHKDRIILQSGYFKKGNQIGEWTAFDKKDKAYKVSLMI